MLDLAIERVRRLPVLCLITFRPEFEAPWKGLPDVADDHAAAASIAPRRRRWSSASTGGRALPAEVMAQIVAKTDGVPLFVEELTKNVLESGLLVEEAERYRLDGPLPPLAIPSTLQDSLMARLDRLAAVKEIAQIGAAIGREFSYPLLHAVVGRDEPTLRAALAQLEESELRVPLRRAARRALHLQARAGAGHGLREPAQEPPADPAPAHRRDLARKVRRHRRGRAGTARPSLHAGRASTEPAIEYWGKAGDLALRRSAFKEAIAHLGKAIEMTEGAGSRTDA